ncbi:MAG: lipoate--protein ligase family protein, partial [Firmicutes bacterium]|nr:lipoate--protein ligase family protein [Bacillota bacterium]
MILGRFQNAASEIDLAEAERLGVAVVRRLSGGGAVYHDLGNLNYSLILACDDPDSVSLEDFTQPAVRACRRFGADASFGGRNDIFADGKKLSGSAQYYRDGRLLHHGCIMIGTDLSVIPQVLKPKS